MIIHKHSVLANKAPAFKVIYSPKSVGRSYFLIQISLSSCSLVWQKPLELSQIFLRLLPCVCFCQPRGRVCEGQSEPTSSQF